METVLLDFSKAFDKVDHRKLGLKLSHYGIKEKYLGWIKAFLSGGYLERKIIWKNLMLSEVFPREQFWDLYFSWYISMICLLLSYHFWGFLPMMPASIASLILCVMHSSYKKTSVNSQLWENNNNGIPSPQMPSSYHHQQDKTLYDKRHTISTT